MTVSPRLVACETSALAKLRFPRKALQQARPAAVDVLAHRVACLGAHRLEFVMDEFDVGRIRPVCGKAHIDFGFHGDVRLHCALICQSSTSRCGGSHTVMVATEVSVPS